MFKRGDIFLPVLPRFFECLSAGLPAEGKAGTDPQRKDLKFCYPF